MTGERDDMEIQELGPRPPLWMVLATFGMGVFAIGYAGFILGSGIPLPLTAGTTLCERLAVLEPIVTGVGGVMMLVMSAELREVADI
jgi:hypothetical protein